VRQRILDELFDDPVRRVAKSDGRKEDDFQLDFTKSGKGLGDEYADDMARKLYAENEEMFLENDLTGPDAGLKREIEEIFVGVMRSLN
jgi:U3 small nucleolar ribonucleoprotein component